MDEKSDEGSDKSSDKDSDKDSDANAEKLTFPLASPLPAAPTLDMERGSCWDGGGCVRVGRLSDSEKDSERTRKEWDCSCTRLRMGVGPRRGGGIGKERKGIEEGDGKGWEMGP
jgi:hypothetical protein